MIAENYDTRDLVRRLSEAQATIEALLSGQIDAVVDSKSKTLVLFAKAQDALRLSEERYRRIVETTNEGVWLIDAERKTTFMNRRMAQMLGCEHDMGIGHSPDEFLDVEGRARFAAQDLREKGVVQQLEVRYVRTDGSDVWTLVEAAPVFDSAGNYSGSMAMVMDITARRQAEAALLQERDRAKQYLDTAEVMLLALDTTGRITLVNRYASSVLGWTSAELVGRDWVETCLPAPIRGALRARFDNVLRGDLSMVENHVLTRSGEERLIEWRNTLLRDEEGTVVGTLSSGTDITEQNKAVEILRVAEERMRIALTAGGVGIWDMNYVTGVAQMSEILEASYGMKVGTFPGTFEAFVQCIHPDDRQFVQDAIRNSARSGTDFSTEHRTVWPDGTVRWLSNAGRIHLGEHGEPLRGVGVSVDITKRRGLEEQYQQAQKMEAVGRLAGGIAHDFNNLLMVITGYSDLLMHGLIAGDSRRDDLEEIRKAASAAAGLTHQLLAFSRQQVIEPKLVGLEAVVAASSKMLTRLIGEDIELVTRLNTNTLTVHIDPGQLEQVIMNLAVNARDAMPTGGKLTIETSIVELTDKDALAHWPVTAGRFARMSVSDTGVGMDEKTRAQIFEPFFTTKEQGKGTGLGLATVYGIVTQSGGFIWVYSEPGHGSTFKIYLPIVEGAPDVDLPRDEKIMAFGDETILLVEDSDAVRDIARRVLQRQGFHVIEARAGAAALDLARAFEGTIDLLLTDVVMPGMSGRVFAETFALEYPSAKLLFMSGYTDDAVVRHGVLSAETPYLQKPFSPHALASRVREVLDAPFAGTHDGSTAASAC